MPPQCQRSINIDIYAGIPDFRGEFSALLLKWKQLKCEPHFSQQPAFVFGNCHHDRSSFDNSFTAVCTQTFISCAQQPQKLIASKMIDDNGKTMAAGAAETLSG